MLYQCYSIAGSPLGLKTAKCKCQLRRIDYSPLLLLHFTRQSWGMEGTSICMELPLNGVFENVVQYYFMTEMNHLMQDSRSRWIRGSEDELTDTQKLLAQRSRMQSIVLLPPSFLLRKAKPKHCRCACMSSLLVAEDSSNMENVLKPN